jgi:hypothetical protein
MSAKIATALHEVMSKVGYVQKTGKNQFHGYKYAGEADLLEKLRPAMVEAGLILLPSVRSVSDPDPHGNVLVQMDYTLVHKDGDIWPEKIGAAGVGNDMSPKTGRVGDKGVYKAITGANKYVLFKLFQIETGDDPERDENHHSEPTGNGQAAPEKRTSSAQLKRDDVWSQMMQEINECGTVVRLGAVKQAWVQKAINDRWPAQWKAAAKEEFEKADAELRRMAEREIAAADEDPFGLPPIEQKPNAYAQATRG